MAVCRRRCTGGEPNDWVRMTRPGMSCTHFSRAPVSTTMAPSGWSMCRMDGFSKSTRAAIGLWHTSRGEPRPSLGRAGTCWSTKLGLLKVLLPDGPRVEVVADNCDDVAFGLSDLTVLPSGDLWLPIRQDSISDPSGRVFHRSAAGNQARSRPQCHTRQDRRVGGQPSSMWRRRDQSILRLSATLPPSGRPMSGTFILSGGLGPDGLAVSTTGLLAMAQAKPAGPILPPPLVTSSPRSAPEGGPPVVFGRGGT